VTGIYVFSILNSYLVDRTNKDISQLFQQVNENVSMQFNNIDDFTKLILANQTIKTELLDLSSEHDEYENVESHIKIETEIRYCSLFGYSSHGSSVATDNVIRRVYLFRNQSVFYKSVQNDGLKEESYDKQHQALYLFSKDQKLDMMLIPPSNINQTIYLIHNFQNQDTAVSIGTLILDIDENILSQAYNNILKYQGAKWFLLDSQGNILSTPDKEAFGETINTSAFSSANKKEVNEINIEGESYIYSSKNMDNYNVTSIILIPKKQVFLNLTKNIFGYLYIIAIILLFSLIVGLRYTYKFTKPIKDLSDKIELVGDGIFSVKMPSYNDIELDRLSVVFNKMTDKIDYLINDVYEKQILLKETELKSLHSQMNPHFMFNVLTTIGMQAKMSNNELIYNMVNSFSQLLQANINLFDNEKITLSEELKYIDFYLYLQNIRFDGKIIYKCSLSDNALLDILLPKFCIQPLVENAVVHGLEGKDYEGTINLNIKEEQGSINIEVIDDGIGFEMQNIDINDLKNSLPRKEGHSNIGLYNINKRIKLIYGNQYGLVIQSVLQIGTKISLHIPGVNSETND
jgi:two-component system sensor histidine kinase YesM